MAGGSLVPLLAGERPGDDPRRGVALSELRLRAGRHADALVDGDLKLVRWADGRRELYDLAGDPGETTNLAAERPEELARLEATLDARILLAEGRAGLFGAAGELDLSPAELQNLADLGYVDDE